jgi:hypothetical protein
MLRSPQSNFVIDGDIEDEEVSPNTFAFEGDKDAKFQNGVEHARSGGLRHSAESAADE